MLEFCGTGNCSTNSCIWFPSLSLNSILLGDFWSLFGVGFSTWDMTRAETLALVSSGSPTWLRRWCLPLLFLLSPDNPLHSSKHTILQQQNLYEKLQCRWHEVCLRDIHLAIVDVELVNQQYTVLWGYNKLALFIMSHFSSHYSRTRAA